MSLDGLAVVLAGIVGLAMGSFANVPIHRWPRKGTVTSPRSSACPNCGSAIRARDNVPLLSWLLLRGRCRRCGAAIHWRYPLVEGLTGGLFAAVATVTGAAWTLPALLTLTWALVVASAIDLEHRIIPNRLTYPLPFVLLTLLLIPTVVDGTWGDLRRGLIAAIAVPAGMLALSEAFRLLRGQQGIGMGDIKLALSLGLVLGYLGGWELIVAFYATAVSAVLVAVPLIATGRAKLATRIPYGPYLALGSLVAVLAGRPIGDWIEGYLGVV